MGEIPIPPNIPFVLCIIWPFLVGRRLGELPVLTEATLGYMRPALTQVAGQALKLFDRHCEVHV